jgi:flagellin-like hook-associated protein FlgL
VTNFDTSAVTRAGTAEIEYSGTADAFTTLIGLRDALRNKDGLTSSEWQGIMGRRLGDIERIQNHLYDVRGGQAVSQQQLNALQTRTEDLRLSTNSALSEVENVDITEVVVRLQEAQNQMQFALAAIAKLNDVSLLNYMQ